MPETEKEKLDREAQEARFRAMIREEVAKVGAEITTPKREGIRAPGLDPNTEVLGGPAVLDRMGDTPIESMSGFHSHFYLGAQRGLDKAPKGIAARMQGNRELTQRMLKWFRAFCDNDKGGMRDVAQESWRAYNEQQRALGGQQLDTGGALVPVEFAMSIVAKLGERTPLATTEYLDVIPMTSEREVVPRLITLPDAGYRDEHGTTTTPAVVEPRWGQIELIAREAWYLVPVSEKWLRNISLAGLDYLERIFVDALARLRNRKLFTGNGVTEPEGIRTNAGIVTQAFVTTSDSTRAKSCVTIMNRVPEQYQDGTWVWFTSQAGKAVLAGLQDTTGRFLLTQLTDEPFSRLLGKPLFSTAAIPSNLGGGSDSELIGGNWKYYLFGDRQQVEAKTNDGGQYFAAGQIAVRVSEQYDGKVAQPEAFVRGTGLN